MKIVINKCYGGFGLSHKAIMRYFEIKGMDVGVYKQLGGFNSSTYIKHSENEINRLTTAYFIGKQQDILECCDNDKYFWDGMLKRTDPALVQVVEELGEEASGAFAELEVVEIPDDIDWYIHDYDGLETVHETHRSW